MAQVYFHCLSAQSFAATAWHRLLADVFHPYRPERHYMRGPGPKWREKHESGAGKAG